MHEKKTPTSFPHKSYIVLRTENMQFSTRELLRPVLTSSYRLRHHKSIGSSSAESSHSEPVHR